MTPRERLLTCLDHREPDRVPIQSYGGDAEVQNMIQTAHLDPSTRDRLLRGDVDMVAFRAPTGSRAFERYHSVTPAAAMIDEWGVGTLRHPDSGRELFTMHIYHPLAAMVEPEELDDYPWPNVRSPDRWEHIRADVDDSHRAGRAIIGQMSQTLVERSYMLRPPGQLFLDMVDRPDFVRRLFETITEIQCFRARTFAQAGVDVLRIGDDLGTQHGPMVSPRMYRNWIKPYHAAVVQSAREVVPNLPVLYHSDGDILALIPDLLEVGVTALNPVQPECMDPVALKRQWAERLTIWGAVGTQRTVAFGSTADVDAEVDERIRTLAPGGGYVFSYINIAWSPTARRNLFHYLVRMHEKGIYP